MDAIVDQIQRLRKTLIHAQFKTVFFRAVSFPVFILHNICSELLESSENVLSLGGMSARRTTQSVKHCNFAVSYSDVIDSTQKESE